MRCLLFCLFLLLASSVSATEPALETEAPPPPPLQEPLPPKIQDSEEFLLPEVVIRRDDRQIIEEYSRNGQVYMLRITPLDGGPSYYLTDPNGDGSFSTRHEHMEPVHPATWKLFEW